MTGVIRLYDIRPLRPGEVEKLAEDSSVLVIQIPGNHTGTARPGVVLVFEVGECYTRTLHLVVHEHILLVGEEQVTDPGTLSEPIVFAALAATLLALNNGVDEARHHVELGPVDLGRVVVVVVGVSFVSANEVGKMDLQCRYACSLGVPQRHPVLLM